VKSPFPLCRIKSHGARSDGDNHSRSRRHIAGKMAGSRTGKVEQELLEYSLPRISEVLPRCGKQDAPQNSSETQAGRATNGAGPI
jgi:hypothetical protein